ncbi:DDE-type integrase/transposase/recombinase [Bacillus aryabhattai]|nr:DDE-type integrase/transposase/recombinase [Priestia aryabhattai]
MAIQELKNQKKRAIGIRLRQVKYLNKIVEQDHRFIKKRVHSMLELKTFSADTSVISGIEAMHMIKKNSLFHEKNLSKIKSSSFMNYLKLLLKNRVS